jgi:regulator of protease activity HflC (stomatin/prohibitin superfamily)
MPNSSEEPIRPSIHRGYFARLGALFGVGILLLMGFTAFMWIVVRIEVPTNNVLVVVNKTGDVLPSDLHDETIDQVVLYPELLKKIAAKTGKTEEQVRNGYKGIRYEVITEGRQWFNPFSYGRYLFPATMIKQNEVGVLIRRFGKPLPFPKTVATEPDERGPVAQTLGPGRYNINLLAYEVQTFKAISIPEGHVGVVTLLSGTDPQHKNSYTVQPGEKGVQRSVLPPGLEYFNPYLKQIDIVDVRSHKYDLVGEDSIHFPSGDSFTIRIEGTIEWAIRPDHVAEVTVAYGDTRDILDKIILPNARSLARIQGSKLKAREFISGKTRSAFQDKLLQELRDECWTQGVDIKSALVRDIQPPAEIATLISNREQADQEIERYMNQMEEAKAEARLVEQQELQAQNRTLGEMKTDVVTLTKEAEQRKNVAVTKANRELAVAKLTVQSAEKDAVAIRSRGQAEGKVILYDYQARAEPIQHSVTAFGDGTLYAQQFFYQKVAPSIQSILANSDGPFADIFKEFSNTPSTTKGGSR